MKMALPKTRGVRNRNPFNIKISANSWQGKRKVSKDGTFEQFTTMEFGLRAGIMLLANAYIRKGFQTVPQIISRFAPSTENNVDGYCNFIYQTTPLDSQTKIDFTNLNFFNLCHAICMYESKYDFSYRTFVYITKKYHIL